MHNKIAELVNKNITEANAVVNTATIGDSSISVNADSIFKVLNYLKTNSEYSFNALQVISGVDYLEYMEVCYMLCNFDATAPRDLIVKIKLTDRVEPTVDSVVDIYASAEYQERECYDMFGIQFRNNPDMRRILCPDDWIGWPLRKDYVAPKFYNGMEVFPDHKMNIADREFIVRQEEILKAQKNKAQ
jgi:NADH-quinone oxidoreductase subunit C